MAKGRRKAGTAEEGGGVPPRVQHRRQHAAKVVRDASVTALRAVQQYPMLVSSYLALRAAELAVKRFADAKDQQRFVAMVREQLATAVARGAAPPPIRLRQRGAECEPHHSPQDLDRDQERAR